MVVKAQPLIEIDGQKIECTAAALPTAPIAMDGLQIIWGREDYFSHTEPAQLSFRIWDATDTWAARIRSRKAIGAKVQLYWEHDGTKEYLFRGSVATVSARRLTRRESDHWVWELQFIAADPMAGLGNVFPVPGVLGNYTMQQRADWLKGLMEYGGVKIENLEFVQLYRSAITWTLEVGKESALELINAFYASQSNDTWAYDAHSNVLQQVQRLDGEFTTFMASYDDTRGAVLISAGDHTPATQTEARPGVALSACQLGVPEGLEVEATPASALNSIEVRWKTFNQESGLLTVEDMVTINRQQTLGEPLRTLSFESWMMNPEAIKISADSAWDRAQQEGALPVHAPISFKAGTSFPTVRMAKWWLTPWENARPGFINGDALHRWLAGGSLDWPPLVSPVGGELHWSGRDGWTITNRVAWIKDHSVVSPIVWANLQQQKWSTSTPQQPWWYELLGVPAPAPVTVGTPTPERDVRWGAPNGSEYRFDESVTWADMRYLDNTTREIKDVL